MSSIAIIPARGGSKRIPRKNIRDFLGKPIIAYSIEAAKASGLFEEVMVSTDDEEIAEVARQYGAQVPFLRSSENADDYATTADVLLEVLAEYTNRGRHFTYACCIYPTAPFVTRHSLDASFELLHTHQYDSVFPVLRFSYPPQRGVFLRQGKVSMVYPEHLNTRSQDLEPVYHDSGQFSWFRIKSFLAAKQIITDNTGGFLIGEMEACDIDTEED